MSNAAAKRGDLIAWGIGDSWRIGVVHDVDSTGYVRSARVLAPPLPDTSRRSIAVVSVSSGAQRGLARAHMLNQPVNDIAFDPAISDARFTCSRDVMLVLARFARHPEAVCRAVERVCPHCGSVGRMALTAERRWHCFACHRTQYTLGLVT